MALIAGCEIPEDLHYDVGMHVWVRFLPDGSAQMGMTDPAQTRAGKILRVTPKKPGRRLGRGETAAILESAKWVGPFPTPLSGSVVASNAEVVANPVLINKDLYGRGWILCIMPERLEEELGHLLTGPDAVAAYRRVIEAEGLRCIRCAD